MTKPISELSMTEECEFSGLIEATCAHCLGHDLDIMPDSEYETIAVFDAQFPSYCTLDRDHKIKKGMRVAKIQHADNPMLPVPGVACATCISDMPKAKR